MKIHTYIFLILPFLIFFLILWILQKNIIGSKNPIESFKIIFNDDYSSKKEKIPKNIIQVWKSWTNKDPFLIYKKNINLLKSTNPSYEYMFFKDKEIDTFFTENYPEYYDTYNKLPINIQKVDFCRYVILYHYGGFYFDLDIEAIHPLDDFLLNNECVFPIDEIINKEMCIYERFNDFCDKTNVLLGQYGFACCKKSNFMKHLIDAINDNIDNYIQLYKKIKNSSTEVYVYQTTGPDFVTKEYINYKEKENIYILTYRERQYFGKYARHTYHGTWKNNIMN